MELYGYFRSSAAYRVRIALAWKGLEAAQRPVHLLKNEQRAAGYASLSASGLVPLLVDEGRTLSQSLAILEYLEETHPDPPLLPSDALGRARVRAIALDIACEIHPLNNLRVLRHLVQALDVDETAKNAWVRHWIDLGLATVERRLAAAPSAFCHGDAPSFADCALVPQIFNARRFGCALGEMPNAMRVFETCMALPAFADTQPSACADAEP